ncbi:MAG: lysophospholipid acyltransferase family protein [Bacteroidota bacterium]
MITANPTPTGTFFWQQFTQWAIRFRFHEIQVIGHAEVALDRSVLMVGNHISWWDGFWALEVNRRLWRKQFHVMMLEEQLVQRTFLRQAGAFSIQPGSRDMVHSMNYAKELLQQPDNLVLMFPQGKIHSQHQHDISFQSGTEKLLRHLQPSPQVIFFAAFLDYFSNPKPTLYYHLGDWDIAEVDKAIPLEAAYQAHYEEALAMRASHINP